MWKDKNNSKLYMVKENGTKQQSFSRVKFIIHYFLINIYGRSSKFI